MKEPIPAPMVSLTNIHRLLEVLPPHTLSLYEQIREQRNKLRELEQQWRREMKTFLVF